MHEALCGCRITQISDLAPPCHIPTAGVPAGPAGPAHPSRLISEGPTMTRHHGPARCIRADRAMCEALHARSRGALNKAR
jgi:hypothetical protein